MSHALAVQAQFGPMGKGSDETWALLLVVDWIAPEDRAEGMSARYDLGTATIIRTGLESFKEPVQFPVYRTRGKHHGSGWDWWRLAENVADFLNGEADKVGREPLQVVRIKDIDNTLLGSWGMWEQTYGGRP
jgi:hypothetical protein